jgi:hypothetical protein
VEQKDIRRATQEEIEPFPEGEIRVYPQAIGTLTPSTSALFTKKIRGVSAKVSVSAQAGYSAQAERGG